MQITHALTAALLAAVAPQDDPVWTGVLDEASFASLHELREGEAPDLRGEDVEVGGMQAYIATPAVGEPLGAVVVIHEWWGLNDHVKHWADRLASDGYTALAVDLYGGVVATTREEAMEAMRSVEEEAAIASLLAAHEYLVDEHDAERTACIGWCFGGGWSLQLAMAEPDLDAAVIYYGRLVDDPEELADIEAPILGIFGERDSGIPPESVDAFAEAMREAGKDLTLENYDADHAFANPSSARYDAENASAAWAETRAFLAEHLFPEPPNGLLSQGGRQLDAFVPDRWSRGDDRPMRAATYEVPGGAECTVVALVGEAGGVPANVNRWCAQMGESELDDDEIESLPRIPMYGRLAPTVRIEGTYRGMGGEVQSDAAMLAAIAMLDGETIFVKMIGPRAAVDAQGEAFAAFCRGLR